MNEHKLTIEILRIDLAEVESGFNKEILLNRYDSFSINNETYVEIIHTEDN